MSGVNHRLLQEVGGTVFWPLRPGLFCASEWAAQVHAGARLHRPTPASCVHCVPPLQLCVFWRGNSLCFLLSQRPLRFYPPPTCPAPCCERADSPPLTWVKPGWINQKEGYVGPSPTPTPQLAESFSSSRCTERSQPAAPARFASVSTHKMSIHATQGYNCATPSWPPAPTRCSWGGSAPTRDL